MSKVPRLDRHVLPMGAGGRVDHLTALGDFVERAFPDPAQLFDHGLHLLVQQLGVDRAVMVRMAKQGYEAFWWATAEGLETDQAVHDPALDFCPRVLQHPARSLVIRDALTDKELLGHSAFRALGVRAYIGVPLRQSIRLIGVLSVQCARPMPFTRAEIAMVNAMANLYLARRRGEPMAIARWTQSARVETKGVLRAIAEALRGEDLLVDLGHDEFQLLLPRTGILGAEILLERIRARIGPIPMGASLWHPLHKADRDDLSLHQATQRATEALLRSRNRGDGGGGDLIWELLEMGSEDMVENTTPW